MSKGFDDWWVEYCKHLDAPTHEGIRAMAKVKHRRTWDAAYTAGMTRAAEICEKTDGIVAGDKMYFRLASQYIAAAIRAEVGE